VAWLVLPDASGPSEVADTGAGPATSRGAGTDGRHADHRPDAPAPTRRRNAELALAVGCITVGVLVLVRWSVPYFPDGLVWPAVIAAVGIGMVLTRSGEGDRARWREAAARLPGNPVDVLR